MRGVALTLACALAAGGPAAAVEDYDACIALVSADAARAEREAAAWAGDGGGAAARHCHALALIATGASSRAIDELLDIAAEAPDLPPDARADVLAQAGELLVEEGDLVTAGVVANQALGLAPWDADALALAASVRLAVGDPQGALGVLAGAKAAAPRLLVLRSAAARELGDLVAARDAAAWATEKAPDMAAAWLERGRVAVRMSDKPAARDALMRAIALDREGELGEAARLALQRMEAGIAE